MSARRPKSQRKNRSYCRYGLKRLRRRDKTWNDISLWNREETDPRRLLEQPRRTQRMWKLGKTPEHRRLAIHLSTAWARLCLAFSDRVRTELGPGSE